jgi:rod shape determining protein RodA
MQVQPSEFTVLGIILAVATFCGRRSEGLRMYDIWRLLVMAGAPIGLIVLQPDLGTSIIIVLVVAGMMIIAGVPPRFLSFLAVAGSIGLAGAIYFDVLQKYQVDRFVSFLNQNSTNANIQALLYEVANAKAAIGAGGFSGAGLFHGMQTMLGYVPEQSTDFIFTAVGEQFGFLGAVSLIALFAFVGWRIWSIGRSARDTMGRVLCIGIFIFFAFSCFENMGMTMGITPVTGIPLPFISYGGSAVMVFFIAGGVVLSISRRSGG